MDNVEDAIAELRAPFADMMGDEEAQMKRLKWIPRNERISRTVEEAIEEAGLPRRR